MSIELLAPLGEKLLEPLLGIRPGGEHSPHQPSTALVVVWLESGLVIRAARLGRTRPADRS